MATAKYWLRILASDALTNNSIGRDSTLTIIPMKKCNSCTREQVAHNKTAEDPTRVTMAEVSINITQPLTRTENWCKLSEACHHQAYWLRKIINLAVHVEEERKKMTQLCKSISKPMILSKIPVYLHRLDQYQFHNSSAVTAMGQRERSSCRITVKQVRGSRRIAWSCIKGSVRRMLGKKRALNTWPTS